MRQGFRNVSIGGHRWQIVASKTSKLGKLGQHTVPAYLPSSRWADFLIYVVRHLKGESDLSFFIVPRDKAWRHSGFSSTESWWFECKNAWTPLLATPPPLEESNQPIEEVADKRAGVLPRSK